jgi:serine/threonine protein kinase
MGSIPFLAPETLASVPELLQSARLDDLFRIDIWALGMTMFSILNPDIGYPFQREFKSYPSKPVAEISDQLKAMIIGMLGRGERPPPSPKYRPFYK